MAEDGDLVLKLHGAEMQELPGKVAVVTLHTSRGDITAYLHPSKTGQGSGDWLVARPVTLMVRLPAFLLTLPAILRPMGISSLRIRYRYPNRFYECVLDILAGVSFLRGLGSSGIAVVGHGQGGAAAIMAGVLNDGIKAVATISSQSFGTHLVRQLSGRSLLVVHGADDECVRRSLRARSTPRRPSQRSLSSMTGPVIRSLNVVTKWCRC